MPPRKVVCLGLGFAYTIFYLRADFRFPSAMAAGPLTVQGRSGLRGHVPTSSVLLQEGQCFVVACVLNMRACRELVLFACRRLTQECLN